MKRAIITLGIVLFVALSPFMGAVAVPYVLVASFVRESGKGFTTDSAWKQFWEGLS